VLAAIQFADKFRATAGKIHNEGADQRLPPKMRTGERDVMAQSSPKNTFRIRWLCAHLAGELPLTIVHRSRFDHNVLWLGTPTPNPSPQGGGELTSDADHDETSSNRRAWK